MSALIPKSRIICDHEKLNDFVACVAQFDLEPFVILIAWPVV